jgi:hypothetical protein
MVNFQNERMGEYIKNARNTYVKIRIYVDSNLNTCTTDNIMFIQLGILVLR